MAVTGSGRSRNQKRVAVQKGYITIKARIFSWTISPSKLGYSLGDKATVRLWNVPNFILIVLLLSVIEMFSCIQLLGLMTVSQKSVDVFIPFDFYNLRFLNPNTNGYYTSLASTSQIQNSVAIRNSKQKLGYNTVESSSYIQNVEQDCRNSQRRKIVSFKIDHRDDDNSFEQELSLASDASQMLPILNDEDHISAFDQQTAHIGTSFIRLRCFIKELVDDQHFGKVRAVFYMIEFQSIFGSVGILGQFGMMKQSLALLSQPKYSPLSYQFLQLNSDIESTLVLSLKIEKSHLSLITTYISTLQVV
ncbi:hypothetical protein QQP08_024666 [Theobroma cacao]|nr:hypothetical protein QQP08_024666 [Theobroma cacao]